MNKTRIAISIAVGATVGVLFARFYSCGIDEVFDRWTTDWQRVTHYHFGCSAPQYPGEGLARTVVLTAPAWLALAVAVWFVLPTVARFTGRCLYAIGIDTRRIAARWSAPGVTPLIVISERPPQERIRPSRGRRLVGMGLMTLWMTYGLLHVLFGSWLFPERAGYEVVGGFLQFGVALSAFLWLRRRHTSAQKTLL